MKRINIITFIILGIGFVSTIIHFWAIFDEYNYNHRYYQRTFFYENIEKNDFGLIVNAKNEVKYFKVIGHTTDHNLCFRFGKDDKQIPKDVLTKLADSKGEEPLYLTQKWVSDIFNNSDAWEKTLSIVSQKTLNEINENSKIYYYQRIKRVGDEPNFSITLPLNFLFYIVAGYIFIFMVVKINYWANNKYKLKNFIVFISICCFSFLIALVFSMRSFNYAFYVFLLKNIVFFLIIFALAQWVNRKFVVKTFEKKELIKFVLILIVAFFFELINSVHSNIKYLGIENAFEFSNLLYDLNVMYFWVYFAVANFMSNLTIYILELRKKEKMFKRQKSEGTLTSSSLASIQSRINPHFLYNALNSIASLARTEPQKTEDMALQLAKFYDQCSDIKSKPMITLAEELEILKSYLKIEKIRFGDRLQVILPTDNDVMECMIPSFTLQPIVENAIKYGYNTAENVITIRITAETNGKSLILRIYDSGPPFSYNMRSGYGLSSIAKKLKVLFPDRHSISFINDPEKCVEMVLEKEY
jgi:sensor histidine kinase YesM